MRLFPDDLYWVCVDDGHPVGTALFNRHYSKHWYKDGRVYSRFVGPGERIVLIGKNNDALFVWKKFKDASGQKGINCSIFRNESNELSSYLIRQAEEIANRKWPGERFYTYVNPRKIKSKNPGYCFKMAGWNICGETKARKLLILEKRLT